jgi:hypothetical protein
VERDVRASNSRFTASVIFRNRPDQVMAFPIDRSEARILDEQQPIGQVRNFRRIAIVSIENPDDFTAGLQAALIE